MSSLWEHYQTIYRNDSLWCYYTNSGSKKISLDTVFEKPRDFILQYFRHGGKHNVVTNELINTNDCWRLQHIISTFFLGLHFAQKLKIKTFNAKCNQVNSCKPCIIEDEYGNIINRGELANPFLYCWFLTCLIHDIAYSIEDGIVQPDCVDNFFPGIHRKDFIRNEIIPPRSNTLVPKRLRDNFIQYYNVKISKGINHGFRASPDHGIIGGLFLYNKIKEELDKRNFTERCRFRDNLLWGKKILNSFISYCAWAIICHNIWTPNPKNDKQQSHYFNENGLGGLVLQHSLIDSIKHPYLFLLCVADSLEPSKRIHDEKCTTSILRKAKISLCSNEIRTENYPHPEQIDLAYLGFKTTYSNQKLEQIYSK